MSIQANDRELVERYFAAMQAGPAGVEQMVSLFAEDGEYVEPFSGNGQVRTHKGSDAIRAFFQESLNGPMGQEVRLSLDRLDLDGDRLRSEWTCSMPMLPQPMHGHDLYTIEHGKIKRLEITVYDMPPLGPPPEAR